jgi:tetratricopeptide (TPR) repeat protein
MGNADNSIITQNVKLKIQFKTMKTNRLIAFLTILFLSLNALAQSKPGRKIGDITTSIADLMKEKIEVLDKKNKITDSPKDIIATDDRIEFKIKNQNTVINFQEGLDYLIPPLFSRKSKMILSTENFEFITTSFNSNVKRLEELRNNFILLQNLYKKQRDETQRVLFEEKAAEYRKLQVKPTVSEEQRKFIVQANLFNQQKDYVKAIELYTKAIELDQTAYPAGYSNLALLQAQINNFGAAISYMKKYLLLEPEATDARSAQDKIYEWEAMIQK